MKTSQKGINLIKKWEGVKLTAYYDSVGVLTIGYGHTNGAPSGKKYPVYEGQKITEAQAEKMLKEDVVEFEKAVNKYLDTTSKYVTQSNFDALVSFSYNLGASILKGDIAGLENNIAHYTNIGKYSEATAEMKLFVKAGNKTLQGLVNRRNDEVKLYLTDKPEVKPEKEDWKIISKKGYFTPDRRLPVNKKPTEEAPEVNHYDKGHTFAYDGYVKNDGWVYLTYVSTSGSRSYVPVGPNDNNTDNTWGKGFFN